MVIAINGLAQRIHLIGRDVTGNVLSIFNKLEVVIRAGWALANNMKRTLFHVMDLGHIPKDGLKVWIRFHERRI